MTPSLRRGAPRMAVRSWAPAILAALLFYLVLVQPNHPGAMTPGALAVFPLELPVILLGLLALPARGAMTLAVRLALVAGLTLIATLKLADAVSFSALSRGFNPVGDLALVSASVRLAVGTFGAMAAVALVLGLVAAIAALALALWWASGVWARLTLPRIGAWAAGLGAAAAAVVAIAEVGHVMRQWRLPADPPGAAFTARVGVERLRTARTTLADLRRFADAARDDPFSGHDGLFARLDRDLLIVFVESYGRSILDGPLYAERSLDTLAGAEGALTEAGFAIRSGWLDAPTRGGQSWLSHMSLATGMRIDGQTRYSAALASDRATLYALAAGAGVQTAAVMPAITLPWPESARIGFETVLAAADLGYAGQPFNWVTMPDQYTLDAMDRLLLAGNDTPVVAQVALISSHAPWVPVPELVDWANIGDGRIFDEMAASGDPPKVVWRDRDRVRAQYGLAVDYALRTVFEWAARRADEAPLLLILGDHQPASFVAGDERPDVPAHLIGPSDVVAEAAQWGWTTGLVPAADGPVEGMEVMRNRLLSLVSTPVQPESAALDSGSLPSGFVDSGQPGFGQLNSGQLNSGPQDSGPLDSGPLDSGPLESAAR